jgi:uncharacterized phage protein gp47/JayE
LKTYEAILERMLARVKASVPELDIREGSLIYTALAPAAAELQLMYIELDVIMKESFADTQSRPFLVRRAAERGIIAKDATRALRIGEFDVDVPVGSRFMLDDLFYTVLQKQPDGRFILECETPGVLGNTDFGALIPFSYIPGLTSAILGEVIEYGSEPETEEQLRRRYFQSMEALAFGGNAADYIQKAGALPDVGGVKVTSSWQGGGTVLLTVTNANMDPPSSESIARIQAVIDPAPGMGSGIAPIGHRVTVRGAEELMIAISSAFTFASGFSLQTVLPRLNTEAGEYFAELRRRWPDEESTIVRISALEQRFLSVPGILDVEGTKLNGNARNMVLQPNILPYLGGISNA